MVRHVLQSPGTAQRFALGVICLGGLLAGIGPFIRARSSTSNVQWTFLLDTVGLIVALVGAGLDFRAQLRLGDFKGGASKRRGALLLIVGALAGGGGCVVLGWATSDDTAPIMRRVLATLVTAGIGAGLAGLLNIGWFGGGDYLERRIEQQAQDEW